MTPTCNLVRSPPPCSCSRSNGLFQVELGSAHRALTASRDFQRAYRALASSTANATSQIKSRKKKSSSSSSNSGKQGRQEQKQRQAGHRSSILGRVIWGSDLRRERESRLVAAGCSLSSPPPPGDYIPNTYRLGTE